MIYFILILHYDKIKTAKPIKIQSFFTNLLKYMFLYSTNQQKMRNRV